METDDVIGRLHETGSLPEWHRVEFNDNQDPYFQISLPQELHARIELPTKKRQRRLPFITESEHEWGFCGNGQIIRNNDELTLHFEIPETSDWKRLSLVTMSISEALRRASALPDPEFDSDYFSEWWMKDNQQSLRINVVGSFRKDSRTWSGVSTETYRTFNDWLENIAHDERNGLIAEMLNSIHSVDCHTLSLIEQGEEEYFDSMGARVQIEDSGFLVQAPGQCACISPDTNSDYLPFTKYHGHNIDSPYHELTILAAICKLAEQYERAQMAQ